MPLDAPTNIMAVGLNYSDHAEEVKFAAPSTPLMFAKWTSALTGPQDDVVLDGSISGQVDYEVELAVVIGREALNVDVDEALTRVAGYCIANDISARDVQFADKQWTRAKSFDGFCPLGPWITTPDEVPDPHALSLSCSVNGSVRQSASTSQMIFDVGSLISHASRSRTLLPGDLLLTGTPSGVAMGSDSPDWLVPGDVVRCEIEGLGTIENRMVQAITTA
jgi:2-keto-4-pentenoate hydratase/2-oxohepta-3-ene-1,7-dioic acid hydratase in catechol pathway